MNRIIVVGSAGSGKSTLAQKLSAILELPVIHLDKYYWKPDWVATANEEFDEVVRAFTREEKWIMDGNYHRTLDIRIERADMIVFLDMPTWLCLYRVLKRRVVYHKKTRPDMNEGCPEAIDFAFMKWIWNYRKRRRMMTIAKLKQVENQKKVVIVKTRKQVDGFIHSLEMSRVI